jgi:chromosome segregation ATPase
VAADQAALNLQDSKKRLNETRTNLTKLETKLQELELNVKNNQLHKQELNKLIHHTQARLRRAQQLATGLTSRSVRWKETRHTLNASLNAIVGDVCSLVL